MARKSDIGVANETGLSEILKMLGKVNAKALLKSARSLREETVALNPEQLKPYL